MMANEDIKIWESKGMDGFEGQNKNVRMQWRPAENGMSGMTWSVW